MNKRQKKKRQLQREMKEFVETGNSFKIQLEKEVFLDGRARQITRTFRNELKLKGGSKLAKLQEFKQFQQDMRFDISLAVDKFIERENADKNRDGYYKFRDGDNAEKYALIKAYYDLVDQGWIKRKKIYAQYAAGQFMAELRTAEQLPADILRQIVEDTKKVKAKREEEERQRQSEIVKFDWGL